MSQSPFTQLPDFIRAAGAAPDAARAIEPPEPPPESGGGQGAQPSRAQNADFEPRPFAKQPPEYRPRLMDPDPGMARPQLEFDTAIEMNRRNVPQEVVDKRSASRYSIGEINTLSLDQITERIQQQRPGDQRPTWVKFLDIIDAPRNFVAKNVVDIFLPEAKRMAIERGEFDQFGQVKVYGADLLRAMGIENKAVNAIGGLALDIFTDPISYIGGPLGGLKTVGTRGAVNLSTKGGRTLRSSIKAASEGKTIVDDAARELIDTHLAWGRAAGEIAEETPQAIREYLTNTIYGNRGRVSRTMSRAGLGGRTRGGTLAEDFVAGVGEGLSLTDETLEAARVNRIRATQKFIAKHTNNPGIDLTKGKGGLELAHVPFTTKTLTIDPVWGVGRGAVVQKAIANAGLGKAAGGAAIVRAHDELHKISNITARLESQFETSKSAANTGADSPLRQDALNETLTELADWIEASQTRRVTDYKALQEIDDIPTLAATARMHDLAQAELRKAQALIEQRNIDNVIGRFSRQDIETAREFQEVIAKEADRKLRLDPQTVLDGLADPAKADDALREIIEARTQSANDRVMALIGLSERNLELAENTIDAFQSVADASADIARLRGTQIHKAIGLGSENALLAEAAQRIAGIDRAALGATPFARLETAFRRLAPDLSSWINARGYGVGTNLGGVGGTTQSIAQMTRRAAAGAEDYGTQIAMQYLDGGPEFGGGLSQVAKNAKIHKGDAEAYNLLDQIVTARVEAKLRAASGTKPLVMKAGAGSRAEQFVKKTQQSGFIKDEAMLADIDDLADRVVSYYQQVGAEMVARGEIDDPLQAYLNVRLADDAERSARARMKAERGQSANPADRGGAGELDPTQARSTNLVEFTDAEGNAHRFLLLEHDWAHGFSEERILALRASGEQTKMETADYIEQLQASFRAFDETFGSGDNVGDRMRLVSRELTPFELNDYADTHALDGLTGGPLAEGRSMWETSAMSLLYHRAKSARSAEAQAAFREIIEPHVLMRVPGQQNEFLVAGSTAQMSDGTKIEALGDGRYLHGGTVYRHINESKFDMESSFVPQILLGESGRDALIPEQLAIAMERMNQVLKPDAMPAIMRLVDRTTSLFKISTLAHPSWFVGNTFGNTILAAMDRPELLTPSGIAQYQRMLRESSKAIAQRQLGSIDPARTITVNGVARSVVELVEEALEGGVITGGGVAGDLVRQWLRRNAQRASPITASETGGLLTRFKTRIGSATSDELARLTRLKGAHAGAKPSRIDQVRAGAAGLDTGAMDKVISTWFGANGAIDDGFRFAHYLTLLDDGLDPIAAAERTRRAMLNFGDMTNFERNYIRPLVPFYAWTRASLPNFLLRTFRQPQHIAMAPKFTQAIEEALAGEERVPRWQRPSWLNETLAVQVSEDASTSILLGTLLPQEGAVQAIGGVAGAIGSTGIPTGFDGADFMGAMNWLYGQTAPAVKVPTELAFGRESFTGREISPIEGAGDISTKDYLLGQVRWLRETGLGIDRTTGLERAAERGPGSVATRLIIGGRASDALLPENREKAFFFELRDEESRLRKAIRRAEGDAERQDELRTELMSLYRNHILRGGNPDDVPKWARQELADLGVL